MEHFAWGLAECQGERSEEGRLVEMIEWLVGERSGEGLPYGELGHGCLRRCPPARRDRMQVKWHPKTSQRSARTPSKDAVGGVEREAEEPSKWLLRQSVVEG